MLCEGGGGGGMAGIVRGEQVKNVGGSAMILMNDEFDGFTLTADEHVLPATQVSHAAHWAKNQSIYKLNLQTNCHNLIQRNCKWKTIRPHGFFLFFQRPKPDKPWDFETRHHRTWS